MMTLTINFDTYLQCVSGLHFLKERVEAPFDEFVRLALDDMRRAMIESIRAGERWDISPEFDAALDQGLLEMAGLRSTERLQ